MKTIHLQQESIDEVYPGRATFVTLWQAISAVLDVLETIWSHNVSIRSRDIVRPDLEKNCLVDEVYGAVKQMSPLFKCAVGQKGSDKCQG